jgi:fibro-slime domain-containing protein
MKMRLGNAVAPGVVLLVAAGAATGTLALCGCGARTDVSWLEQAASGVAGSGAQGLGGTTAPVGDGGSGGLPGTGGGGTDGGGTGGTAGSPQGGGGTGGSIPVPDCGNGLLDPGEACDDANPVSSDGCSADCSAVEPGFVCPVPGQSCEKLDCGDGYITGTETCDDANEQPSDGCDASCQVEPGYKCPRPGARCIAAQCGDGIIAAVEQCDDGHVPAKAGDGCDEHCRLEPGGWSCPTAGQYCQKTNCGNQVLEGNEQCDDGDHDTGDGCSPACAFEPDCSGTSCTTVCGDGIWLSTEQCDDGNNMAADGCDPSCQIEHTLGYACEAPPLDELVLPITLRDFKAWGEPGGHADFERGIVMLDPGIVTSKLGPDGKPVYAGQNGNPTTHGKTAFDQWYRDTAGVNLPLVQTLTLPKQPAGDVFQYSNQSFFPIDGQGYGNYSSYGHNFHFTSEIRYWFQYASSGKPPSLSFFGDDDVWVFINKQLAVDIGGVHGSTAGSVTLDAPKAQQLGLQDGKVYEIAVFQAERQTVASTYQLTLANFSLARSLCHGVCGDGILTPEEACDDGINKGGYNQCGPNCTFDAYCGDEIVNGPEECDDGANVTHYVTQWPSDRCAPGCVLPGRCGNGQTEALFGEQCDGEPGCGPKCHWL